MIASFIILVYLAALVVAGSAIGTRTSLVAGGVSLAATSAALFGEPDKPLTLLIFGYYRLDVQYWSEPLLAGWAIGALSAGMLARTILAPAVFVAASLCACVVLTAARVDTDRAQAIAKFGPDRLTQNSFLLSLREPRRGAQLYLHAAALKRCVPYAWSYRVMGFYPLPPNVAVNVLPSAWIGECQIVRVRVDR